MKILFFGRRFTYFRNFDSVLRELASTRARHSTCGERETDEGRPLVDGLIAGVSAPHHRWRCARPC